MTFEPTEEQFKDPLQYIQGISHVAQKYGIVKITPPKGWAPDTSQVAPRFEMMPGAPDLVSMYMYLSYTYVYVPMCMYMYVYVCIWWYFSSCTPIRNDARCTWPGQYVYVPISMYMYLCVCTCMYMYVYDDTSQVAPRFEMMPGAPDLVWNTCAYIYVGMYMYLYVCRCVDMYGYVCTWICMCMCVCIYVNVCIWGWVSHWTPLPNDARCTQPGLEYIDIHMHLYIYVYVLSLLALLRKMTCNLRHPMGLRHPVRWICTHAHTSLNSKRLSASKRKVLPPKRHIWMSDVTQHGWVMSHMNESRLM